MAESTVQKYKFDVKMTCSGCSGAVTRALMKAQTDGGVKSFNVNLETQEVLVEATLPYDDVLSKIKKTGKEVRSGSIVTEEQAEAKPEPEAKDEL